jgi:hypothetical protein
MHDFSPFGKSLIIIGLMLVGIGLLVMSAGKIPWLGRMPGDILIKGKNFTFYFPLATSILVSIVLSLMFSSKVKLA